jgi:hypothetical protein
MQRFKKGNKEALKRKRRAGGRPTKEQQAEKKATQELAREKLEARVDPVMDEYLRLAEGGKVKKGSSPATIRHAVDHLLPPEQKLFHSGNIIFTTNLPDEGD